MPAPDTFFARQARKLMRRPVKTIQLQTTHLEDRVTPAVSGFAYQDFNANGTFDTTTQITNLGGTNINNPPSPGTVSGAIDTGFAGLTVRVFDSAGNLVDTKTTAANGSWTSNATVAGQKYRVEYTGLNAGTAAGFYSGPHGTSNATATQFVTDGATAANLGVVRAQDFYPAVPLLVTPIYVMGGQDTTNPALISFPYSGGSAAPTATSADSNQPRADINSPQFHDLSIPANQIGTTWGLAYNRPQGNIYASSFAKRHSNWRPGALGSSTTPGDLNNSGLIYTMGLPTQATGTTPTITSATPWINFNQPGLTALVNGVPTPIATIAAGFESWADGRASQTSQTYWETDGDNVGWNAVGKNSFGGLDTNDAGTEVYVMNLADRRLYVIPVLANGGPNTAAIRAYDMPTVAGVANQADVRPFAVEFHEGQVYIGLVNSAESTVTVANPDGDESQLRGYVYSFNPVTNTYSANSLVSDGNGNGFGLNYNRAVSFGGSDNWAAWSPIFRARQALTAGNDPVKWAQPMISGITFDSNNNIVLSLRDRAGDQTGNAIPDEPGSTSLREGISVGDTLMAFNNVIGSTTAGWSLERNGSSPVAANPATGASGNFPGFNIFYGPNSKEGPSADPTLPFDPVTNPAGEYFGVDFFGANTHRETSLGAATHIPGFPDVVSTHFDPVVNGVFRSGGTRWYDTTNDGTGVSGNLVKGYELYTTDELGRGTLGGTLGKANGLGDLIAISSIPPVEIGNRIFSDGDRDGIQDANEAGIGGVNVELRDATGATLLATAVTAADGSYFFNSGADPDLGNNPGNEVYGLSALAAGKQYIVRIPNTSGGAVQTPLKSLIITTFNNQTAAFVGDTNQNARNSDAQAKGTNGDITVSTGAVGESDHRFDAGFAPGVSLGDFVWEDANNNGTFEAAETKLSGIAVRLYLDANGDGTPDTPATPVATTTTGASGDYLFAGLTPDKYVVEITTPAGYRSSSGNAFDPITGPFESGLLVNSNTNNEDHGVTVNGDIFGGFVVRTKTVTLLGAGLNPDDAGNANLRQDFGIYRTYSLGNLVFNDKNNDGLLSAGEAGINGVTVSLFGLASFDANKQLLVGATPLVTNTVTANGGFYRFDNLIAGQYVAVVTGKTGALANFVSSTGGTSKTITFEPTALTQPAATKLDNRDEGTTLTGNFVRTGTITLGPGTNAPVNETNLVPPGGAAAQGNLDGQADMTDDFGFYQPLSLGNQIFNDANNSGLLDGTEAGIANVKVTLFRAGALGTPLESQTTNANGFYLFTGLGTDSYVVQVDSTTLPAGFLTSTGKNGSASGPFEPGADANTDRRDGIDRGTVSGAVVQNIAIAISPGNAPLGIAATPGFTDPALDADSYRILDFGFYQPLSLGSLVWNDANNDGKFAGGELGIDGVPVTLYFDGNASGAFEPAFDPIVNTQNTKSGGQYLFTNLSPGGYFVEIAPLGGSKSSTGASGQATGPYEPGITAFTDNEDHGTQAGAVIRSGFVNLQLGANPAATPIFGDTTGNGNRNYTIDFGIFTSLSVGDFVWNDVNNDGKFQVGEPALSGVTVKLLSGVNVIGTTTTNTSGNYLFTDLSAGTYTVQITAPAGFLSSTGKNGSPTGPSEPVVGNPGNNTDNGTTSGAFISTNPFNLLAAGNPDNGGAANLQQDFGLFQPLALGDQVFIDINNNGKLDSGEQGLANVPVTLLDATGTTTIASTTTDATGLYGFSNLVQGTYVINIAPGAGYISSSGKNGSLTGAYEPGVSGTQNNEDHGSQFDAANIRTTAILTAAGSNPDNAGNADLRQDFGVYQPLALGNFVFNDVDNNGLFDGTDKAIANVPVALLDGTGTTTIGTTTTDANGLYGFTNLTPGSYIVRVTPPTGLVTSTGKNGNAIGPFEPGVSGTQDNQDHGTLTATFVNANVTLAAPGNAANPDAAGFANLRQDFGLFQPISVGSFVWIDANDNGKFDTGEQPIGNVPVQILDGSKNVIATTTTDAKGAYNFTNLSPGTYFISIAPPAGVLPSSTSTNPLTSPNNQNVGTAGPNGTIVSPAVQLNLGAGPLVGGNTDANAFITFDFGLLALGTLSGFTYFDPNINGLFTPGVNGDVPIGGTLITLTGVDANGAPLPTRTTRTDNTGFYQFTDLSPGTYTVTETQPAGYYYDGLDTPGNIAGSTTPRNDVIVVPLGANQDSINNNFGEIPFAGTHGYVWIDSNNNCQKDPGEGGLPNVPITISGTAFPGSTLSTPLTSALLPAGYSLTVLTDASGFYAFPVLPPGNYTIARGDLPVEARNLFANSCLQNGDPNPNPPTAGNQFFSNVSLNTPVRGPFNFGVIAINPGDPSKRNFLGSSGNTANQPNGVIPPVGGPTRGPANLNPAFTTTTGVPTGNALVVIASGVGQRALVRVLDYAVGGEKFRFEPYGAYTGGVRVAQGDVDGDGVQDIVTATGQGGGPRIRVFSGATGLGIRDFFAYEDTFRGGVFVASADVDGDGKAEIITGTELGGGPRVRVFNAVTGAVMQDFFAFSSDQRGGVRVAAADFNGDGKADIAATTGIGTATRVRVFNGQNAATLKDYFAFGSTFTLGANIAAGDVDGDGQADILVGTEAGGGPRVQVYSGKTDAVIRDVFAFDSALRSGVRVAARDINGDGKAEIIATAGESGAARVRILNASNLVAFEDFFALDPEFRGGAYVG